MPDTPLPLLIALPHGLNVSGVTLWAVRLVNALADAGSVAGLIVHCEPEGQARLDVELCANVRVFDATDLPPIEHARGELSPFVALYGAAVREMAGKAGSPVVLSPNLHGDCYGVAAALTRTSDIRVVAWQHSDIEYNYRVLAHYEPIIARLIAVSGRIRDELRGRIAARGRDVVEISYGVPVPQERRHRPPIEGFRPLRLIYTGRLEHEQKRVRALVLLSDELHRRGRAHELTLVGDGPASDEIDAMTASRGGRVRRVAAASPERVTALLDGHDLFVLASRYEGLSVSMLEAMARGCVPIVTRVESGATEAIKAGKSGLIADAGANQSEAEVAAALADAVEAALLRDIDEMSRQAWRTAGERFSIDRHAARVREMLCEIAGEPARRWPGDRACAFSAGRAEPGVGSGSVPAEGVQRMREVLEGLAGRKVVIYGAGEHTRQLAHIIEASPIRLVAIADDDPGKHGSRMLGVPIIGPGEIAGTGASDVVISSWMHERSMHDSVAGDSQGTVVHCLYAPAAARGIRGFADSASAS